MSQNEKSSSPSIKPWDPRGSPDIIYSFFRKSMSSKTLGKDLNEKERGNG